MDAKGLKWEMNPHVFLFLVQVVSHLLGELCLACGASGSGGWKS